MKTRAIKQLLEAMEQGGYRHLDLQIGDERIKLVRDRDTAPATAAAAEDEALCGKTQTDGTPSGKLVPVLSDRVGVYSVGKTPIQVGGEVKKGQAMGVIKGISIQDTVAAPLAGIVRQIHVHEGDIVEFGRRLFEIEPA
ncbi:MAG TPA: biotin/lipoyl-binding protein [Candidatus Ozemobacteraceae bacterium]|nr:biotin/lipoyl-binding protein [Candidatus Ozemobacteraceae bacterium]